MSTSTEDTSWEPLWEQVQPHLASSPHHPEIEELKALPALLRGVRHFVDVGASYGPYSWIAHFTLQDSQITAIEGNPALCRHLEKEWNLISSSENSRGNDMRIINSPISNKREILHFEVNENDFFTSSISGVSNFDERKTSINSVEIEASTLDDLFEHNPPDLIKIDIEGAEWRAIEGSARLLRKRHTKFLVEIHPWGDVSLRKRPSDVFALFRRHRYSVCRVHHHWLFRPQNPSLSNYFMSIVYGFACDHKALRRLAILIFGGRGKPQNSSVHS